MIILNRFKCNINNNDKIIIQKVLDKLNTSYSFTDNLEIQNVTDLMNYIGYNKCKFFYIFNNLQYRHKLLKFVMAEWHFKISINPLLFDNGDINLECFIDFKDEIKSSNYNLYLELSNKYGVK